MDPEVLNQHLFDLHGRLSNLQASLSARDPEEDQAQLELALAAFRDEVRGHLQRLQQKASARLVWWQRPQFWWRVALVVLLLTSLANGYWGWQIHAALSAALPH